MPTFINEPDDRTTQHHQPQAPQAPPKQDTGLKRLQQMGKQATEGKGDLRIVGALILVGAIIGGIVITNKASSDSSSQTPTVPTYTTEPTTEPTKPNYENPSPIPAPAPAPVQSHSVRNQTSGFVLSQGFGIDLSTTNSDWNRNDSSPVGHDIWLAPDGIEAINEAYFVEVPATSSPTYQTCANAHGATGKLDKISGSGDVNSSTDFCVYTNQGLWSFVHVSDIQMDGSNPSSVTLSIRTWN